MKFTKHKVVFEPFSERHFIRTFAKKYKSAWDFTFRTITEEFEKIDVLFLKSIAEYITDRNADVVICKTEFKISGTQESRHGSGNRCIVAWNESKQLVSVLLVYNKTDLSGTNETAEWKKIIKDNYPAYKNIL
ncbi:MAG: hypothetical protein QG579_115 [Patescibacteria group bacterium]|jgi:hypothetical protein|nr:hypothetical protein [Patescibacteria group bacterium]